MYSGHFLTYPASQYPNPGLNIPAGVNYPDKKNPSPDTPGYPFTTGLRAYALRRNKFYEQYQPANHTKV